MSGSGGGGGGGGGVPDTPSSCNALKFKALLASPQPAAVATLRVGEFLDIDVAQQSGQVVVRVLKKNGTVVGALAGPDATRVRNCIDQGHDYQAEVLSINLGQVHVEVTHV